MTEPSKPFSRINRVANAAASALRFALKIRVLILLPAACAAVSAPAEDFETKKLAALPAQAGGRIQPLDTLARNSLLLLRGTQSVPLSAAESVFFSKKPSAWNDAEKAAMTLEKLPTDDRSLLAALEIRPIPKSSLSGRELSAPGWLAEAIFRPEVSRRLKVFRIDNGEILTLLRLPAGKAKHFSWQEIEPGLADIKKLGENAETKPAETRSPFETGVLKLYRAVQRHHLLTSLTFFPGDLPEGASAKSEYQAWEQAWLQSLRSATFKLSKEGTPAAGGVDAQNARALFDFITRYRDLMSGGRIAVVPPRGDTSPKDGGWNNLGATLLEVTAGRPLSDSPQLSLYSDLRDAYRSGDDEGANRTLVRLASGYTDGQAGFSSLKTNGEVTFNAARPFYHGLTLYALAAVAVLAGWITSKKTPLRVANALLLAGFALHTAGLAARMWIQGRPPVTNLYSSAVFVGWGAAIIGLVIERFWKNGVGASVAATVGFCTLIVAHQLGATGEDTIEMMRAVLDSNFWLATHVVVITFGYSAMFVAGFIGAAGILRSAFDGRFDDRAERALVRAGYGALCFALLASFVGTMLGGVWADQSWGRFWGWDPKENGALLIVLWCALTLHARLAGAAPGQRFLQLLVFGNIVTAWSWFGTNMLGVGLHSYGFTNDEFLLLSLFMLSQMLVIGLGLLPKKNARSPEAGNSRTQ